mmetsp:Transcript_14918/g.34893  ORF Transcript_14918/g.34893 Transcript_14918/m.34893 type:complete len:93 (+) Transcript_14918:218-496(+)
MKALVVVEYKRGSSQKYRFQTVSRGLQSASTSEPPDSGDSVRACGTLVPELGGGVLTWAGVIGEVDVGCAAVGVFLALPSCGVPRPLSRLCH